MNWRAVWAIVRKEALDTVRDRRTLVMMLGVPILLYPALLLLLSQVAMVQQAALEEQAARVALSPGTPAAVRAWIAAGERIQIEEPADPAAALAAGELDVIVSAPEDFQAQLDARKRPKITLQQDATEFRSREAAGRVEKALDKAFEQLRTEWLAASGLTEGHVSPFEVGVDDVSSPEKRSGALLGLTLPVLLVIMLALGAFYPAVDLTAGEKERGTFETLLSTPCGKLDIVAGKFLVVFGIAMVTALLNFGSMAATLAVLIGQVQTAGPGVEAILPAIKLEPLALGAILLVLVPLAFLISAMMMAVAVFARSFKEAQNYLTPFVLVIALPAAIAGLPGMELGTLAATLPIANVVLLFKDLMTGEASLEAVFIVLLSTSTFAGMALLFAAWLFQREEVVLGGGAVGPLLDRAAMRPASAPSAGLALGTFCVVLILILYLGAYAQARHLLGGLLFTEYVLILGPALLLPWWCKVDLRRMLAVRGAGAAAWLGAICAGLGGLVLVMQVGAWHNKVLPVPREMEEAFKGLFASGTSLAGLTQLLLVVAVTPAICEEVLFRGTLFSGLRGRMHPLAAVLLVGFLFGVFHLSIHRFVPTALLGVLLTWIAWRSGSLLPGVAVHALVNGLSILLATGYFPETVALGLRLDRVEADGVWWPVLAAGACLLAVGGVLLLRNEPKDGHETG